MTLSGVAVLIKPPTRSVVVYFGGAGFLLVIPMKYAIFENCRYVLFQGEI
jgi:hypothetical protein